jgi:hypothetical protein
MSANRLFKIALFCGAGIAAMMAPYPGTYPAPRLSSEAGAAGRGGAPHQPGHHGPGYRRAFDAGVAAGAAAGDVYGGYYYYAQPQQNPASMPNCTDELQQEQGAYYNRIGQRRFCY